MTPPLQSAFGGEVANSVLAYAVSLIPIALHSCAGYECGGNQEIELRPEALGVVQSINSVGNYGS